MPWKERYLPGKRDIGSREVGETGVRLTPGWDGNWEALASRH